MNAVPLHAFNPGPMTGAGNWTWLISGRVPTLIDAGTGDRRHLDAIEAALDGQLLAHVVVTHGHSDHASGAEAIAARWPAARFLKLPWRERDSRWHVEWTAFGDGDRVAAGDTTLDVVHTPGHAPDHLCLWHAATRTLFGGDLAIEGTTVYVPAAPHGDLTAYLVSLERVLSLHPRRILPAHGAIIEDPATVLGQYLTRRRERERQVIDALRAGDATAEAIATRIYGELDAAIAPRAQETITAHLQKLQRDGRAGCLAEAWHMIEP